MKTKVKETPSNSQLIVRNSIVTLLDKIGIKYKTYPHLYHRRSYIVIEDADLKIEIGHDDEENRLRMEYNAKNHFTEIDTTPSEGRVFESKILARAAHTAYVYNMIMNVLREG